MLNHRNTEISKANLITRNGALRLSLLISLGLFPGACGGSSSNPSEPGAPQVERERLERRSV